MHNAKTYGLNWTIHTHKAENKTAHSAIILSTEVSGFIMRIISKPAFRIENSHRGMFNIKTCREHFAKATSEGDP